MCKCCPTLEFGQDVKAGMKESEEISDGHTSLQALISPKGRLAP